MRYFAKQLSGDAFKLHREEPSDIVDIQISCDAKIFSFLLDCCTEVHETGRIGDDLLTQLKQPQLLFPVLVSSVFLQIEKLIGECLAIWKCNFAEVMGSVRIPVSQLEPSIFN